MYSKTGKHTLGETYEISESIHLSLGTDPMSKGDRGINKMTTLNSNNLTNKAKELQELSEIQRHLPEKLRRSGERKVIKIPVKFSSLTKRRLRVVS